MSVSMQLLSWLGSTSVGLASVPVASTHVLPASLERQKPTVFDPSTAPTYAYTVAPLAASVVRPVPTRAGVVVASDQVAPSSDDSQISLLSPASLWAAAGSLPPYARRARARIARGHAGRDPRGVAGLDHAPHRFGERHAADVRQRH